MGDPQVRVEGARELRAALKRAGVSLQDLKAANQAVAELVAKAAAPRAPRRTGRLAGSLRPSRAAARARITSSTVYGGPIHWGWPARHITAQPWLAETAHDTEAAWLRQYQAALDDIIRTVERTTP